MFSKNINQCCAPTRYTWIVQSKTLENIRPLLHLVTFEGIFCPMHIFALAILGRVVVEGVCPASLSLQAGKLPRSRMDGWMDGWMFGWVENETIVEWQWCFLMQYGFIYKAIAICGKITINLICSQKLQFLVKTVSGTPRQYRVATEVWCECVCVHTALWLDVLCVLSADFIRFLFFCNHPL